MKLVVEDLVNETNMNFAKPDRRAQLDFVMYEGKSIIIRTFIFFFHFKNTKH